MKAWHDLIASPWFQTLGWTLLHFLWEGALLGFAASILFRVTRGESSNRRYLLACALLALCAVAPLITFVVISAPLAKTDVNPPLITPLPPGDRVAAPPPHSGAEGTPRAAGESTPASSTNGAARIKAHWSGTTLIEHLPSLTPWLVPAWLAGVALMCLRFSLGWTCLQYWRWTSLPVGNAVAVAILARLREDMKLATRVTLRICDRIHAPCMLGWLRPCILLPSQVLTGLSPAELRAILAHELAHIARNDYLVNLLQSAVEIVLFYHPVVWWLSTKIRETREECCDEAALQAGADRVTYAQALVDLAEFEIASNLAPSAAGGPLFRRVARLLGRTQPEPAWSRNHAAWMLSLAGALFIVLGILHSSQSFADATTATSAQPSEPFPDDQTKALRTAVRKGDLAAVRQLLGPTRTLAGNSSLNDLMFDAVLTRNLELLQLLLDHGMNINATDASGQNALVRAIYNSGDDVVRFLVNHGININRVDKQGTKPAWYVANMCFFNPEHLGPNTQSPEMLEYLRKKGATFGGENKSGATIFTFIMHVVPVDAILPDEKPASETDQQKAFALQRAAVRTSVAGGADVNMLDSWLHETPLIAALLQDQHVAAATLIDLGADVTKPDDKDNAPILFSALQTWNIPIQLDLLKELLARGADPNSRTKGVDVMESLPSASTSVLELLLEHRGNGEVTATSDQNLNDAVQIVLGHGGHFTGQLSPAVVSLLSAAASGDLNGLKRAFTQGAPVNTADEDGWTPLMVALSLGHEDCVQWLLANGADVTTKNAQGYSPLFFAVIHQQEQRVADFLKKGADPNCGKYPTMEGHPTDYGSAIWLTVKNKNLPIFKLLLDAGVKVTAEDIGMAIQLGQVEIVKALLDKGANPDSAKPFENRGSVYWAVFYNQPEILKLLIAHGADLEMKTDYDETPLSIARQEHKDMVPILEAAIAQRHLQSGAKPTN